MGQKFTKWWYPEPKESIHLRDIFPELLRLEELLFCLCYYTINNIDAGIVSGKLAKIFHDKLFHNSNDIRTGDFSPRLRRMVDCAEYFYCSNVNNPNKNYLFEKIMKDIDSNYPNLSNEDKKKSWYKNVNKIIKGIEKYIDKFSSLFEDGFEKSSRTDLDILLNLCLPNDNPETFDVDNTKELTINQNYCIGYVYDLITNIIDVIEYCIQHEYDWVHGKNGCESSLESRRNEIWKKWWIKSKELGNDWERKWHLLWIMTTYKDITRKEKFRSIRKQANSKEQKRANIFKNFRAIIYRMEHFDFKILGNIPDNSLTTKNNDKLVLKYVTDGNDFNNGVTREIRLGDFNFESWQALGDALRQRLGNEFRTRLILPPAPNNQVDNDEDGENGHLDRPEWKVIQNLFHQLGGYGNDQAYDNSVVFLLESDYRFRIMGKDSTMNRYLKIGKINLESRWNDPNGSHYYNFDHEVERNGNRLQIAIPPIGPYYYVFGPFNRNFAEDMNHIFNRQGLSDTIASDIGQLFIDLGFKVTKHRKFNVENAGNQQPAQ